MRLGPDVDVGAVARVGRDPRLSDRVVKSRPTGATNRATLVDVLLEPGLEIRAHGLAGLGSALVRRDRSEHLGDAVAQRIIGGARAEEEEAEAL